MKNKIFHTQDLCLRTNLRCAKNSARMEINMHKFLRAVGLSDIKKEELEKICKDIEEKPDTIKVAEDSEGNEFAELCHQFGDFFGLTLRGTYREDDTFEMDYYYPYFFGTMLSTREQAEVEKHAEKESYAGICDEVRIGVTLIFYLQNVVDFLAVKGSKKYMNLEEGVILGALSTEGKILLPINKTEKKISRTSRIQRTAIIWLQPQEMGMKMRSRI